MSYTTGMTMRSFRREFRNGIPAVTIVTVRHKVGQQGFNYIVLQTEPPSTLLSRESARLAMRCPIKYDEADAALSELIRAMKEW